MPKVERKFKSMLVKKTWKCPVCSESIVSVYDGHAVRFSHRGKTISMCGGLYEKAIIVCPGCGSQISFTREELESEES